MNDDEEALDDSEAGLRAQLAELRLEHQDLDDSIEALSVLPVVDQLQIARLKKKKLALKDAIQKLEDRLIPDILACGCPRAGGAYTPRPFEGSLK